MGLLGILLCCTGCPTGPTPADGNTSRDVPFLDSVGSFDGATALVLGPTDELQFTGAISSAADADLFELGVLAPGDRLHVDVQRTSDDLDGVIAIFNAQQELLAYNDDRSSDSSDLNPLVDFVVRGKPGGYFLGIAALPGSGTTGTYQATVRITRSVGVPPPAAQVVFLDWNGGRNLVVENVGVFDLTPFDAADVGLPSPQTAALKARVQQIVKNRYRDYDLVLLNSDDDPVPSDPHTSIYFGGASRNAFAISEHIDTFNADPSDNSIIFTRSYAEAFSIDASFEELAQALGNTVAHEIGHLLGLVHTADCDDLMDTGCGNDRILRAQFFKTGRLDRSVFPIGVQNAIDLLTWILGLSPG